ncbi:hypothetical protein KKB83_04685 [Patescibacteria group bacterium]|nr:hypothetical protein [Patescibacteria group bacterium]
MSQPPQPCLFVDIGSVITKAVLFSREKNGFRLTGRQECLTSDRSINHIYNSLNLSPELTEVLISYSPKVKVGVAEEGVPEGELIGNLCQSLVQKENFIIMEIGAGKSWLWRGINGRCESNLVEYGVGGGARRAVRGFASEAKLARWLTEQVTYQEVGDYVGNKSIFPWQLPDTQRALFLEQALAREILTEFGFVDWDIINRVILGGAVLAGVPAWCQLVLMFLDGTSAEGVNEVWVDQCGLLPFLSRLGEDSETFLVCLGTTVALSHRQKAGSVLGRFFLDWGLDEEMEVVLKSGDLIRVPLSKDQECAMKVELAGDVELRGFNPEVKLKGGEVGLVIDARGRPLIKPKVSEEGRKLVKRWKEALK